MTADEFLRAVGLIYLSGVMALVAGLAIVYLHKSAQASSCLVSVFS